MDPGVCAPGCVLRSDSLLHNVCSRDWTLARPHAHSQNERISKCNVESFCLETRSCGHISSHPVSTAALPATLTDNRRCPQALSFLPCLGTDLKTPGPFNACFETASLYCQDWLWTHNVAASTFLSPGARIIGVCHHTQTQTLFFFNCKAWRKKEEVVIWQNLKCLSLFLRPKIDFCLASFWFQYLCCNYRLVCVIVKNFCRDSVFIFISHCPPLAPYTDSQLALVWKLSKNQKTQFWLWIFTASLIGFRITVEAYLWGVYQSFPERFN